jgi:signal transduction histidine kinase
MRKAGTVFFLIALFLCCISWLDGGMSSAQDPAPIENQPVAGALPAVPPASKPEKVSDDATLNLHRWGAVTLFHGLPSDRVNAIAEGSEGLMWFGTDNGLVRYDGRNVEAVPNESLLPSRRILALCSDPAGALWIGTDQGAARFYKNKIDPLTETRGSPITAIAASPEGEIAIVSGRGEIFHYPPVTEYQPRSESSSILSQATKEARSPAQAIISRIKLDPSTNPYHLRVPNQGNESLPLTAVSFTTAKEWAIGSSGRGLLLNRSNELIEAALKPPRPFFVTAVFDDGVRLWIAETANAQTGGLWIRQNGGLLKTPVPTGAVTAIAGAVPEIWVGSARQGAFLVNADVPGPGDIKTAEHLTFENTAGGLRSNNVTAIHIDREGVVWFGTDRGVCRYDRTGFRTSQMSESAQSNFVRSLLYNRSKESFSGTNRGLFQLAGRTKETNYDIWIGIPALQDRSIHAMAEDVEGTTWAGTNSGLFFKAKNDAEFRRFPSAPRSVITIEEESAAETPPSPPEPPAVENNSQAQSPIAQRESIRALAIFRGQLYASFFERGIERIDGNQRVPVMAEPFARQAICMAAEGDSTLWIGTANGELWSYDGSQARQVPMRWKESAEKAIRALAVAPGALWIGSSNGLFLREKDQISEIKPGIDVRALLVADDSLWIASRNSGLIKYRRKDEISIQFDTEQGLASQQVFALAAMEDNDVMIGTNRGVTRHRPSAVAPKLMFRRLVADRIYPPDSLAAQLPLPHTQKNFILEVNGLGSRTFSSQFQYEFTIEDKNLNKVVKVTSRLPLFSQEELHPGTYKITVRAISRDLVYSAPLSLRLRVSSAPFPRAQVLLASLLAMAIAAAAWAFRQQRRLSRINVELENTNAELHETRLRLANETEAERSRIARDLHDQTLADLRHLLVLTDQMPAVATAAATGEEPGPSPSLLRREIESISAEIRHICEDLSPSVLENIGFLPALEWALAEAVAHLPAAEKFTYEFSCGPELEDRLRLSHIEQIQLYRITQEALNNICRHAQAKHATLTVRVENTSDLLIEICDDGTGFDGQGANKTGHGIANIRSRANLIGAEVAWQNLAPGCRFSVRKTNAIW